jgi:hypothetical protein
MGIRKMINHDVLTLLCVCVAICFLTGCDEAAKREIPRELERERVTSPNGQLDAVLIREDGGGAAGGWEWYVYIVAKGRPVVTPKSRAIFNAGTLTGEKISWSQDHLLQIRYDIASINQFGNIWGSSEIDGVGGGGKAEYFVEIRLVPSSPDFSLLTRDGEFKPKN